ncbi:MAG TPA: hypothetical protein VK843_05690 [Planctomycetota bacterium]|nr:hypothetical protein [Planctomycetota bacterium]
MPRTPQSKTQIRRSIELLTQVTQRDHLKDHASMIEAQRQFQTLRDEMAHTESPSVVLLASLGERLSGHMYKDSQIGIDDLRKMITEIAEHIAKQVSFNDEPKAPVSKTNLKLSIGEMRLALRDGQRLGELLVKMTMLTPAQVEEAVVVQRATGQRLGEALLQMRLLTPDMLESALRVQKTKRSNLAKSDDWNVHKKAAE